MVRIFLVDDHAIVIEGIYSLLQNEKDIQIAGYATNGEKCLHFFATGTADIVLMDISLPDMNGIELCALVRKRWPETLIIALSTFNQGTYVRKMMEAGASGYLLKNAGKHEFIEAIKTVIQGKTYFSSDAKLALKTDLQLQNDIPPLTKREKEVLSLIAEGFTNIQMAEKLFISPDTIDSHRKNLYTKLHVKNTAMLVRVAIEKRLI